MARSEKNLKVAHFGDYTFDFENGVLRRGTERVHLRPLAIRLLSVLLSKPESLVAREELRRELWGSRVVEWEMGLHRLIRELRQALGEDSQNPRFIHTVPKRGYRFSPTGDGSMRSKQSVRAVFGRGAWFLAGVLVIPAAFVAICLYLGLGAS